MTEGLVIEGLEPISHARAAEPGSYVAPRVASLAGATVAMIANGLGRSPRFMEILFGLMKDRYGAADCVLVTKPNVSIPPSAEDWARVVESADVALTAFGGCGSCSSRTVRDAIDLERVGIPAVPVVHEALYGSARTIAELAGMPEFHFATVSYPHMSLADWDDAESLEVADEVVADVVRLLTVKDS